jgi:hypothetical protein
MAEHRNATRLRVCAAIVVSSLSFAAVPAVVGAPAAWAAPPSGVDGQIIVEWRKGTTDANRADALADVHAESVRDLTADPTITADVDLVNPAVFVRHRSRHRALGGERLGPDR